jgi:ankyrin repeat protein
MYLHTTLKSLNMGNTNTKNDVTYDIYEFCLYDNYKDLEKCLKRDADPNKKDELGMRPLEYASSFECIKLLLEAGAEPDIFFESTGSTPLQIASIRQHTDVVKILLKYGANPNIPNMNGLTALDHAVHACNLRGNTDIVESLLSHGADVNHQDASGFTVLHRAIMFNNKPLVHMFLDHGADPLIKTNYDKTCIEMASYFGYHDIVNNIMNRKLDVISV